LKTRYELIGDIDYLDKLTDEEKVYLNSFYEEYINANFRHENERVHPVVKKTKTIKTSGKTRKTDEFRRESEHRNNARNRCVYTKAKAMGMVSDVEDINNKEDLTKTEDKLINAIDNNLFKQSKDFYDSSSGRRKRNHNPAKS